MKNSKGSVKILAVSSTGGHWIQLNRLSSIFRANLTIYVCTSTKRVGDSKFYIVKDASRWNKLGLLKQMFQVFYIVIQERPSVVITTGASVGIWAMMAGWILGAKTIWLDSIANYEKISLSGRLAKPFCSIFLTQWEHLENKNILYKGNVL